MPVALRAALGALLGVLAAVLISCGASGAGLIPAGNAGPLQHDFEAIAAAAQNGNGSCESTKAAIETTERDFRALPGNVDNGLRNTLRQGIANLREKALVACTQPLAGSTGTSTTTKTTDTTPSTTTTTTTPTDTTPPSTTPSTSTTPPPTTTPGGGTPAPGAEGTPGGQGGTEPGARSGGAGSGEGEGGK